MNRAALEEALYEHESPYYRYCASGFPLVFADPAYCRAWERGRASLERRLDEFGRNVALERATNGR